MNFFELVDGVNRKIERFFLNRKYRSVLDKYNVQYSTLTLNGKIKFVLELGCKVSLGDDFICSSGPFYSVDPSFISSINVKKDAVLKIGKNTGMTGATIHAHKRVIIGDNVNIGAGTMIFDTNFHSTNSEIRADRTKDLFDVQLADVIIENNVFIGARSLICKGVTIGENAMISAGSVVVKNVPKNELWGGNPAIFIKQI
jgi:acetyltransferase-like isoleucine patch superfamily enzyme